MTRVSPRGSWWPVVQGMSRRLAVGVVLVTSCTLLAGRSGAGEAEDSQARLVRDMKYLSSDELEGRGLGTKGLDLAAEYVREQFTKAGLEMTAVKGDAYQKFTMTVGSKLSAPNSLTFNGPEGKKLDLKLNSEYTPLSFGGTGKLEGELVFVGYGIDAPDKKYSDYEKVDVKGKIAVMMRRNPQQAKADSPFGGGPHGGVSQYASLDQKARIAFQKGAIGIIFVNDPYTGRDDLDKAKKLVAKTAEAVANAAEALEAADPADNLKVADARKKLSSEVIRYKSAKADVAKGEQDPLMKFGYGGDEAVRSIPIVHITRATADQLLKASSLKKSLAELEAEIDKELKPQSAVIDGWKVDGVITIDRIQTEVKNVIAVLPGSGPLADETVVVGAHYDHVGRGGKGSLAPGSTDIHNGADDNASGTVSLLEVARRLAARKEKLPRRVVFIAFTAEEVGLIGSARYTKEPVFPLDKTVAMLNMDMVGRLDKEKLTVFGTGTSPVWKEQVERLGKELNFQLSLKPEGFGPSDHSSFYAQKIPVLHFFTGNHGDYHRPSDDWDKINYQGMQRIVDLVERIASETALKPERPAYVAVKGAGTIQRDGNRPYFGSIPDFGSDLPGYSLGGVAPGSPAEKGGLKAGDRIIMLGMAKVENLNDFDAALRRFAAGDTVKVTVMRGQQQVTVDVVLEKPR